MFKSILVKALFLVSVVAALAIGVSACGGGGGASHEEIVQAEKHARQEKTEKEKERHLEREIKQLKEEQKRDEKRQQKAEQRHQQEVTEGGSESSGSGTPVPVESSSSERSSCGGSLSVGPDTTCEFAENVESEYFAYVGEGSGYVEAYSPANDEWYSMYCTGSPHECTGAISARVYFP